MNDEIKPCPHAHLRMEYAVLTGNTYLQAAMRCYVTSKLGNEVDVPEELL